ncbi:hypothetical protein [Hymenobacter chitinivorans]|uniref:Uncharacterized protein n=1 Tax=Hymenobacter chitinivorans DSM 11115 TaxID=1121954 RepID=A0A2M9BQM0_9BACT|nr:hypothetical protein [Hymenobacter chitinivorans]PJJ60253.1 hypothetical protein CLV45_1678 [Hymenobacter chitinivorans DSM 11115]
MADSSQSSGSWADTAASLLSKLSGGVELNLAFDQMELQVPNPQNPGGPAATWRLNGSLRIRTRGENPAAGAAAPQLPASKSEPLG